jgi:hypothetical protein
MNNFSKVRRYFLTAVTLFLLSRIELAAQNYPENADLTISLATELTQNIEINGEFAEEARLELGVNSKLLGSSLYESLWLRVFLQKEGSIIYHHRMGWHFDNSLSGQGYRRWDDLNADCFWTDESFSPWLFSDSGSTWYYFNLDSEKVRFLNHNLQEWSLC